MRQSRLLFDERSIDVPDLIGRGFPGFLRRARAFVACRSTTLLPRGLPVDRRTSAPRAARSVALGSFGGRVGLVVGAAAASRDVYSFGDEQQYRAS